MFHKFLSTNLSKVIVILAVGGLLIFLNPKGIFNPLRQLAGGFFSPFQKVAYLVSLKAKGTGEFFSSIGQIKKENEELIRENQRLLAENAMLNDAKRRSDLLEKELNLLSKENFTTEAAYVIGEDPQGTGNWVKIDKGNNKGIKEGMPVVVAPRTLVGKVGQVQGNSAQVVLLTNPESVAGAVAVKSGAQGVVQGKYGLGMLFHMVSQTDTLQAGDEIVTSGIGGNFPRGLFIGNISDIQPSADRLFQEAGVVSPVQFSKLEVVFVIK